MVFPPRAAGLDIPPQARSFFDALYQAGRLRAFAGRAWRVHQQAGPRSVSDFQLQVGGSVGGRAGGACLMACRPVAHAPPRRRPPAPARPGARIGSLPHGSGALPHRHSPAPPCTGTTVPRPLQVYRTIRALGVDCALEHSEAGEYSIDVAVPARRIAGQYRAGG